MLTIKPPEYKGFLEYFFNMEKFLRKFFTSGQQPDSESIESSVSDAGLLEEIIKTEDDHPEVALARLKAEMPKRDPLKKE